MERGDEIADQADCGKDDSLCGLFTYAIIARVIAVFVLMTLARIAEKIGGEGLIDREVDG